MLTTDLTLLPENKLRELEDLNRFFRAHIKSSFPPDVVGFRCCKGAGVHVEYNTKTGLLYLVNRWKERANVNPFTNALELLVTCKKCKATFHYGSVNHNQGGWICYCGEIHPLKAPAKGYECTTIQKLVEANYSITRSVVMQVAP